jgi:hypothetical protein
MYELGLAVANGRFISSALIVIFQLVLPLKGDSQGAIGYLLLICVFVLACSCGSLARALFDKSALARAAFIVVSTASGYVITFLHANNFDQLVATSLLPLMATAAFWIKWGDARAAIVLGGVAASVTLIYPELAALMLLVPVTVLVFKVVKERPQAFAVFITGAVGIAAMAVGMLFFLPALPGWMASQFHGAMQTGVLRPGEGYFPTFFTPRCLPGAFFMLYEPFLPCSYDVRSWTSGIIGAVCIVMLGVGIVKARGHFVPFAAICVLSIVLAALILIRNHYDYGAYKILTVGFPFFAALIVNGFMGWRSTWSGVGTVIVAGGYLTIICLRLLSLDATAKYKSVDVFRGISYVIPSGSVVALKIKDHLAFEWASYYLRTDRVVPIVGNLTYLPAKRVDDPLITNRIPQVRFLISDLDTDDCWGAPLWQSNAYRVYKISPPVIKLECVTAPQHHS